MSDLFRQTMALRWRLVMRALPFVVIVAFAKVLVTDLEIEDIALNPLYTGLVAGNVFLLGFLLAGTLSDYKDAEKLPSEAAAALESIADECMIIHRAKGGEAAKSCLSHLHSLAGTVMRWLYRKDSTDKLLDGVRDLDAHFAEFDSLAQATYVNRLKLEQAALRRVVLRIDTIRETSFVVAGYLISELTSIVLISVLLFINVGSLATDLVLLCTLTLLLVYMLLLIQDLDNPFAFGEHRGTAEVSLAPLFRIEDRLGTTLSGLD